ncbi:Hypp1298 [Branchiostoma lanceolatum]|uniref:Hypp1298 protein n=1 Tax=Branchiostoma lanceolatum TaxID=7740 RepID=A0A8J9ZJC1_BRALA|nr:Hypp1298 [Branchiostoma lanceolatum]
MCNQFEQAPPNMADTTCVRVLLDVEPSQDVICFCSDLRARRDVNVVEGWTLTPHSRRKQPQTSAGKFSSKYKQPNNLLNRRKGSATPEKYVFQHFDDAGSYMRDYRQKYTCLGKQDLIEFESPVMSEDGDSYGDSASTITRAPIEIAEIPDPVTDPSVSMPTNRQQYSSPSSEEDAVSMTTHTNPTKAHSVTSVRTSENTLQVPAKAGLSKITVQTNRLPDQQKAGPKRGPSRKAKLIARPPSSRTTGSEDIRRPSSAEAVFLSPVGGYLSASPAFGAFRKYHRKQNYQQVGKEKRRLAEMYGIANLSSPEAQQLETQQGPCPSPRLLVTCKNAPVVKNGALVVEKGTSNVSTPKMPPWPVRPKSQSLKPGSNRALDGYVVWDASEGKWTINTTYVAALMTYNQATPDVAKMLRQYMSASAKKGPASL